VAFVAGKKVGNAVKRNRAKRVLRAHFYEIADNLKDFSYIIVAKPQILNMDYNKRKKLFEYALKKCGAVKRVNN